MKKDFLLIAAAATMLTACVNTDTLREVNSPNNEIIGFSTFESKLTRAGAENSGVETKQSNLETHQKSFDVWGYKYSNDNPSVETRVFNKQPVSFDETAQDWTYSPLIFWDKGANHYNFYAASPTGLSWAMDDGDDNETNTHNLSLASHEVDGASLAIADANLPSSPTTGASATWYDATNQTNVDIMISNDITDYKSYSSSPVNLEFMHILSRLNISVKIADILDSKHEAGGQDVNDYVVKLKSVKVFNLRKNGKFNESGATGTALSSGTTARWEDVATAADRRKFTAGVGFTSTDAAGVQLSTTEKYFYQTLVIPQKIDYQLVSIDGLGHTGDKYYGVEEYNFVNGTNIDAAIYNGYDDANKIKANTSALVTYTTTTDENSSSHFDKCSAPYIEICYTITPTFGTNANVVEEFKQYYNLAAAFGKSEATKVNTAEPGQPAVYVNQFPFNEGWMNNLRITINPIAITFDADVFEWGGATGTNDIEIQ